VRAPSTRPAGEFNVPPDRQDGKSSFLHRLFLITGRLSSRPPWSWLPLWLALIALASWPWPGERWLTALLATAFLAADWTMLALLPIHERSWGPVTPSLLALTLLRTTLAWLWSPWILTRPGLLNGPGLLGLLLCDLLLSAVAVYATWIEPFRLTRTTQTLPLPHWCPHNDLRILHLTDLHYEGPSPRERAVLAAIDDLTPDLILLTGDYLNLSSVHDPTAQAAARAWLAQLEAPLGVYAVTGSPAVDVAGIIPEIFAELPIHWLDDSVAEITWQNTTLWLLGVRCTVDAQRDAAALRRVRQAVPRDAATLLLYHTPDLMPEATALDIDLYLAGHTHGGQLRVPLYGALFTSSRWGKRYEMGRYQAAKTTLYVSRGLGMEGLGAPRARFLAPPEIVLWTLTNNQDN
jgi:predicted MPP superfamily phosphohydrolase